MKRNVILIGLLVLGLLFLTGCGRKPEEVELGEKELILREETSLPEETVFPEETVLPGETVELPPPVAPTVPPVEEKVAAPSSSPVPVKPTLKQVDTDGDGIPDTWVMVGPKSIPTAAPRATTSSAKVKETGKLNINTATAAEMDNLPGLGPTRVERIIAGRPYAKLEDLRKIPGIGPTTYDRIKDLITVGAARPTPTAAPTTAAPTTATPSVKEKGKLNINTATAAEIDNLPGLGPTRVERIIAGRPYAKIEDLRKIPGIGSTTYDRIKDLITVN